MFIIFDTETTGLPKNFNAPITDGDNWPRMVQIAWQLHGEKGELLDVQNYIVKPEGYEIPFGAEKIHGISTERAMRDGKDLDWVLKEFNQVLEKSSYVVGHNIEFDIKIMGAEYVRKNIASTINELAYADQAKTSRLKEVDTKLEGETYLKRKYNKDKVKWPKLGELHQELFGEGFDEAHNASADVVATARCFLELVRVGISNSTVLNLPPDFDRNFTEANPSTIQPISIEIEKNAVLGEAPTVNGDLSRFSNGVAITDENKVPFTHLHLHTQYSILDGAATIGPMVAKAKGDGMDAVAITDHGNMFGVKEFHDACLKNELKPIIGCEVYLVDDSDPTLKDRSNYHLILLAKNEKGYQNLMKLVSFANLKGMYYKPRIDKKILKELSEGLIASSACLGGEVSRKLMHESPAAAEAAVLWYKEVFGDDFYLEVMRHPAESERERENVTENQHFANPELVKFGQKHNIKVIATNDVHFINEEDASAHDLLICLSTGKDFDDPNRMRYTRHEWFKTSDEMYELWKDYPEAILNTREIVDKVEVFKLNQNPIMPEFDVPQEFATFEDYRKTYTEEDLKNEFKRYDTLGTYEEVLRIKFETDYLEHLTLEGAKERYGDTLEGAKLDRIKMELDTIKQMGFPGYFLIVQDFIAAAREMGVLVGPGRGSAAGAAVSYCLKITNIDPIKYDLLFERFLNPDRISMPDIDIDFDDDGRQQVLDWVTDKYGKDRVAHICTFGSMAAKSAIKDVARVLKLPLDEANRLTKEFPENGKLKNAYNIILGVEEEKGSLELAKAALEEEKRKLDKAGDGKGALLKEVQGWMSGEMIRARQIGDKTMLKTFDSACRLEGSVRQTGVHACGILIGKTALENNIPLLPTKGEELLTTQYDGRYVEAIGLLKMDFLGLKTLSIIKETLANIKISKGIDIDIEEIPIDDTLTYELFARGETTAIFQFESPGMKKHLRGLKPDRFEDLVAMNALYRPGPMEYIPDFIARKHGKEVEYDHPLMETYLNETFGITVFQEQVMLLSRLLGGFTRGQSDTLRKAMGKKKIDLMNELKVLFEKGCLENKAFVDPCKEMNKDPKKLIDKIWKDWEAFASYAFNKSHSVCYAYVAYQTGYLKAHYPAEFMAANLSRNLNNIADVAKFMEECQAMGMQVLTPDVNESYDRFTVNAKGDIRFGMAGVKNVGGGAVLDIIKEREQNGPYKDIYDFAERVNLRSVSKKNWESLALAGAFDNMGIKQRSMFFANNENEQANFIENILRYGNMFQLDKAKQTNSLFGDMGGEMSASIKKPQAPACEPWSMIQQLAKEKELIGVYLSAHPLDEYKIEIKNVFNTRLTELEEPEKLQGKTIITGGMVTETRVGTTKKGNPFTIMKVEDYNGAFEFALFGDDHVKFGQYANQGTCIMIKANVQSRWKSDDLMVKIGSITFLSEVGAESFNKITLELQLQDISNSFIDEIESVLKQNVGSKQLYFRIVNSVEKQMINTYARALQVDINPKLLKYIEEHEKISYAIN